MNNISCRVWLVGALTGVLAVLLVDVAYTLLSSPGVWLVPYWLAIPYGTFTAWRSAKYVGDLLRGSNMWARPPLEGFALMVISTFAYAVYMRLRAEAPAPLPLSQVIVPWSIYAILVGCFGAAVAAILMVFDMAIVRMVRSPSKVTVQPGTGNKVAG